ncbi:MAG: SDR family oxidoreductase [Pseudomonadota bacterium]
MTKTALVTGASVGIGAELARYHAKRGGNLILTARREEALNALKTEVESTYSITAHIIALDLAAPGGADALYEKVKEGGHRVDILINNAGFGGQGAHIERKLEDEMAMIDLNIKALVTLTHRFAADMVAQGGGKILNVGSTAGFAPGPNQAVYFATKAFVNSFGQAVDQELRKKGVTSTVLAPGYVETEFAKTAGLEGTDLVGQKGATPASVARVGYDAMRRGELVAINEKRLDIMMNWVVPFLPRRAVLSMIERAQTKA